MFIQQCQYSVTLTHLNSFSIVLRNSRILEVWYSCGSLALMLCYIGELRGTTEGGGDGPMGRQIYFNILE